jgi:hypothetical protein
MDIVLDKMLREGVPITQEYYLLWAYWDRTSIDQLGPEEIALLPSGFFDWPRDEREIN